jgi:hypothetical protein
MMIIYYKLFTIHYYDPVTDKCPLDYCYSIDSVHVSTHETRARDVK